MHHFIRYILAVCIIVAVFGRQDAEAAIPKTLEVTIESKTVTAPGAGSLDILIENIGPTEQALSAFQLQVLLSGAAGVTFTGGDEGTPISTYVFGSDGGSISFAPISAAEFIASDFYLPLPGYVTIDVGEAFRLARAYFNVSAAAPNGFRPVGFVLDDGVDDFLDGTQFYDDNIAAIPYDEIDFVSGGIDVQLDQTALVPEPASLSMGLIGGCIALGSVVVRRRRKRQL